jgi:cell division protein FtsQ
MRRVTAKMARRPHRRGPLWKYRRIAMWNAAAVLIAAMVYGGVQASSSTRGQTALQAAGDMIVWGSGLLGLTVSDIIVEGRETTDRETILSALAAGPGTPIMTVDPRRAKEQLEALPWVSSAVIERRLPGTLHVRLVERKPLALWQHGGRIELIDREGAVIPVTRLDQFAKLPLVVGEGAASRAAGLLDMLATEPDLEARVTAAVRVGDRRWNLRIDNAVDVLLPADETAAGAWSQLAGLERTNVILKRDVQTIDIRLPDRLVLRVAPEATKEPAMSKKAHPAGKST